MFYYLQHHWIRSIAPQCGSASCWPRCELQREKEDIKCLRARCGEIHHKFSHRLIAHYSVLAGRFVAGNHGGMQNSPNRSTMPSPLALDLYWWPTTPPSATYSTTLGLRQCEIRVTWQVKGHKQNADSARCTMWCEWSLMVHVACGKWEWLP